MRCQVYLLSGGGRWQVILLRWVLSTESLYRLMTVSSKSDKCSANIAFYVFSQTPVALANISPIKACYMSTCDWWKMLRRPPDLLK